MFPGGARAENRFQGESSAHSDQEEERRTSRIQETKCAKEFSAENGDLEDVLIEHSLPLIQFLSESRVKGNVINLPHGRKLFRVAGWNLSVSILPVVSA